MHTHTHMAIIKSSIKIQNLYINFHLPTLIHLQQDYVNYLIFNLFLSLLFPFRNMKHITCNHFYRFHLQLSRSPKIPVPNKHRLKQSFYEGKHTRCLYIHCVCLFSEHSLQAVLWLGRLSSRVKCWRQFPAFCLLLDLCSQQLFV